MGVGTVASFCRAFLVTVLLTAGASKLGQRDGFFRALAALPWLPLSVARRASVLVPALEIAVAVALLVVPRPGAIAAALLVGLFSAVIGSELASGRRFRCGCFGGAGVRAVGADALVRNALLLGAAAVVFGRAPGATPAAVLTGVGAALLLALYEVGSDTLALARQR